MTWRWKAPGVLVAGQSRAGAGQDRGMRVHAAHMRGADQVLATSLYDDPAAGLCGDAPAGLDEHPEHGL
jgi:hypothetical protein